tara:strand:+ start:258 stop:911 length:654 start_codon:yes stop_codon:yes gene_type:complete
MLKVFINGKSGKMGQSLLRLIKKDNRHTLHDNNLLTSDVVIDFSHPDSTSKILKKCKQNDIPLLIGTTGLDKSLVNEIKTVSKRVPILLAANMSIGINQLKESLEDFINSNEEKFDCLIEETHHSQKIDKPSGTAIELSELLKSIDKNQKILSLKIISYRKDDVFGVHKVTFKNKSSSFHFQHEALSRDVFADGALFCAKKLVELEPNLYAFRDIIK